MTCCMFTLLFKLMQAILGEEERVVVIRFGHDWDPQCMQMDEILASVADQMKNFAVIFLVDISEVPDFNTMYELYDPCTTMFFFRNKHIMVDLGTGAYSCLCLHPEVGAGDMLVCAVCQADVYMCMLIRQLNCAVWVSSLHPMICAVSQAHSRSDHAAAGADCCCCCRCCYCCCCCCCCCCR
jgi:hypothetical protein